MVTRAASALGSTGGVKGDIATLVQPRLRDRMLVGVCFRHDSNRTEQTYCRPVKRFVFHQVRHPGEMAEQEINAFLTCLTVREKVRVSTEPQSLSAIFFLCRHVLGFVTPYTLAASHRTEISSRGGTEVTTGDG